MTVCTPHRFAGPHECPYCQRDALQVEAENLRFRLALAESNNPDSVLSKHNAMCLAIAAAGALKLELKSQRGTVRALEADIDSARKLLWKSGSVERDTPEYIDAVYAWLDAHPEGSESQGPEYEDGPDADGFKGGDERFAHPGPGGEELQEIDQLRTAIDAAILELREHLLPLCGEGSDVEFAANAVLAVLEGKP